MNRPKSVSGKWALGFGVALVASIVLSVCFAFAIGGDPAIIERSRTLSVLAAALSIVFTVSGPVSFVLGAYTAIRHKDWDVVVSLIRLYALTFVLFALGEFLFPH